MPINIRLTKAEARKLLTSLQGQDWADVLCIEISEQIRPKHRCACTSCQWTGERTSLTMPKPCPGCGGRVVGTDKAHAQQEVGK